MKELTLFLIIFIITFFFNFNVESWHNRQWFLWWVIGFFIFYSVILALIIKRFKNFIFKDKNNGEIYDHIIFLTPIGGIILISIILLVNFILNRDNIINNLEIIIFFFTIISSACILYIPKNVEYEIFKLLIMFILIIAITYGISYGISKGTLSLKNMFVTKNAGYICDTDNLHEHNFTFDSIICPV